MEHSQTLPFASSLCGACYEVCPVKIDIPEILIHLRNKVMENGDAPAGERMGMKVAAWALSDAANLATARALGRIAQIPFVRDGVIHSLPGMMSGWTSVRDMPAIPAESFRQWWARRAREKRPRETQ
jgi:L-lactate dehydrogenase complex protein LldF